MSELLGSVISAAASATGKVFVIGAVGYVSVLRPKGNPLIESSFVGNISRVTFNLFTLSLVYSTMAIAVDFHTIQSMWFVVVSGIFVVSVSFLSATVLECLPIFKLENRTIFEALRIAATFPNIVAFPILLFPALCEYELVYEAFTELDPDNASAEEMETDCVEQSNQMIFVYFFAWNLMFWIFGNQILVRAGNRLKLGKEGDDDCRQSESYYKQVIFGLKAVLTSSGFIAMVLGLITASIPPLQRSLFESGGALRFIGSAIQSLAAASPSLSTIIVAASLVKETDDLMNGKTNITESDNNVQLRSMETDENCSEGVEMKAKSDRDDSLLSTQTSPLSDGNHMRLSFTSPSLRNSKMIVWFGLSRLVLSPALVCTFLVGLDCGGVLMEINPLAKMVILLNSAVPGALIVVIVLKTRELTETATIVAEVYLPIYLLSVVTISFWSSIGLIISIPDDNGNSFCSRYY